MRDCGDFKFSKESKLTLERNDMTETTLATIEAASKRYAEERGALADAVSNLNRAIEALKIEAMPRIKKAVARTAERENELRALVDGARHLFVKPRTVIFHGIKVGLEKGKGKIEFDDEEKVIRLIRKNLPGFTDGLVIKKEMVSKTGLKTLTVAELKSIGCTVEETNDQVIVRATDTEVEKVIKAMLKGAAEEREEDRG